MSGDLNICYNFLMSSPSKPQKLPPQDKLDLYDKLIKTHPEIERKGVSMPYTSLNGNMFTYLSPEGVFGLRLPESEREDFLKKFNTTLYQSYGSVLKEYVTVPNKLLEDTETLKKYFALSYAYVKTLKPKPSKKKK